jgi:hypothetical protein
MNYQQKKVRVENNKLNMGYKFGVNNNGYNGDY